jgi:hypothetical protein
MVTFGERYLGAWQETASRIAARDTAVAVFITLIAALAGASLSGEKVALAGILVGYFTLPMALFSRHHDLVIGYLNKYQLELSLKGDPERVCPEWFASDHFRDAMRQRHTRDIALGILILFCSIIGLFSAHRSPDWALCVIKVLWWISLVCCLSSVVVVWETGIQRGKISDSMQRMEESAPIGGGARD